MTGPLTPKRPNLRQRAPGGVWYVQSHVGNGHRVRVSTRTKDREAAERIAVALIAPYAGHEPDAWREFVPADADELLAYLAKSRERAIKRDRRRDRVCELSSADILALYARSAGRCEVTRIPFSLVKAVGTFRRPFAPSIDRLDNGKPYSLSNCRLICLAVNIGINEWGEAVFQRVAAGFIGARFVPTCGPTAQHLSSDK